MSEAGIRLVLQGCGGDQPPPLRFQLSGLRELFIKMQMSLKGSPISLCQLMGLTEQNTTTCREVRRPGARSPLLQFATGSSLSGKEAKSSLPSLSCPDVFERELCSRGPPSPSSGTICSLQFSAPWWPHLLTISSLRMDNVFKAQTRRGLSIQSQLCRHASI